MLVERDGQAALHTLDGQPGVELTQDERQAAEVLVVHGRNQPW